MNGNTVGTRENFAKIWAWTAAVIFAGVLLAGWDNRMIESAGGFAGWALLAGFAAVFPGVMVAALVKVGLDIIE